MRPITLSPAGKQSIKIVSHIELTKKKSYKEHTLLNVVVKRMKRILNLQNIALTIGSISALTSWFASIIYDATNSRDALIILVVSVVIGVLSLFPLFFYGKSKDKK